MTRLTRTAAAVALSCALVAGTAATSFAADAPQPTPSSSTPTPGPAHPHACARATHAEQRLDRVLTRIQADASHQGSVAWLEDRAADAAKAGKTDRAATLRARADRRENRVPKITAAQTRLESLIATHCSTATPSATPSTSATA